MTIGEKIKLARSLRGITQKELGFLVDLPDVRIRQYEIDARTPKEGKIADIAAALGVSPLFLKDHDDATFYDMMHILFEQEINGWATVEKVNVNGKDRFAVVFDNTLNEYLKMWHEVREKVASSKMSKAEYALWQAKFPESITTSPMQKSKEDNDSSDTE